MMRTADIINTHIDCDFVDINMGCPIGRRRWTFKC